jgi:HEAT repeat protein
MRTAIIVSLLIFTAGCARRKPALPAAILAPAPPPPSEVDAVPGLSAPSWQGATVQTWEERLTGSRDPAAREQASQALRQLGEAAYPSLQRGLHSRDTDVRFAALQALPRPVLEKHQGELKPQLVALLRDRNAAIRRAAAGRLSWLGASAATAVPTLQELARQDSDHQVREAATTSMRMIQIALSGKPPDYVGKLP